MAEHKESPESFITSEPRKIRNIPFSKYICENVLSLESKNKPYMRLLNNNFHKVPADIDGIHTRLTEYQRTAVAAMIELEEKRECPIITEGAKIMQGIVKTNAGVYSDCAGSGKTIVVQTLIHLKKFPFVNNAQSAPEYRPINLNEVPNKTSEIAKRSDSGYKGYISRVYKKVIPCTIVFAGVSVAKQWCDEIETFTNLRYLEVTKVKDLDLLMKLIENGDINNYDIIVVKNGNISRVVKLPENLIIEDKNMVSTPFIYNMIGNMRHISWARCIIDDFDNIQLPPNASLINALFTWYISSTTKIMNTVSVKNKQFKKTDQILMYDSVGCGTILRNQLLFTLFNIRNESDFISSNNGLTIPIMFAGIYTDPNDRFTRLIDVFSNSETNEIVEMLNSGSINTAAEKAGVAIKSAADIFKKILGKNYKLYKKSVEVLKFIEKYDTKSYHDDRLPASEIPEDKEHPDHTYTKEKLLSLKVPEYKYPNLGQLFRDVREEQQNINKTTNLALTRLKDNIRTGNCPICTESIKDIEGNLMICQKCSVTGCESCIIMACGFCSVDGIVKGRCPMCRRDIEITDMIHISENIELLDIVNDKFNTNTLEEKTIEEKEEPAQIDEHDNPDRRTKISALIDIINNKIPVEFKRIVNNVEKLQGGKNQIIESDLPYRKILVFTSFEESIDKISKALTLRNIAFWRLGGTSDNINQISRKFNTIKGNAVLIINSSKHCAGLNLQTADWLVYFHKIKDSSITTQIAGRGQRLGRLSTLKIAYLLHRNEAGDLKYM
jgi:SNF2 family DNA or RNA helicase